MTATVFRAVDRPVYDDMMRDQIDRAQEQNDATVTSDDALGDLLAGADTWTVA